MVVELIVSELKRKHTSWLDVIVVLSLLSIITCLLYRLAADSLRGSAERIVLRLFAPQIEAVGGSA